jgi:hypothetical protein
MSLHFSLTLSVTACEMTKRFGASLQLDPTMVLLPGRSSVSASTPGLLRLLALLDNNTMHRQRPGQSVTEYVHFMRQSFDDYNETCQMIDGYVVIHPHNLGLLMLCGISSSCQYGKAKQCAIKAFDIDYHNGVTRG